MSDEEDASDDKEHEASPQKLIEARRKGDIPRSADLMMAASTAGFVAALVWMGGWAVQRAGSAGMTILDQAEQLSRLMTTGSTGPLGGILVALAGPPLALLLVPPVGVLVALFVTRSFLVTARNLAPKLSRISPIATARHKFGTEGLFEFAKSFIKLCLISACLWAFLTARLEDVLATIYLTPAMGSALLGRITIEFLLLVLLVTTALGGLDYAWQVHLHRKRNRMSRKELMDEYKESEGDPHFKAARRQRAQDIATNRMLADVEGADVVIVNPTHYAVALRWDRGKGGAPVCVAKGVDEIARVIRERAALHGVPVHSDPPAARAIYAAVELGQEIRIEHFRAVAAAIRFADAMRKKARQR
jgi:flagellar biosynthetic protein FlhB